MTRSSIAALALIAIATAGCGRSASDGSANGSGSMTIDFANGTASTGGPNANPASAPATPVADASLMRPGRWEGTMRIKVRAGPGIAPLDQTQPLTTCITPDQLRPGNNPFAAGLGNSCRYDQFRMGGGKVEGSMSCGGQDTRSDMTGEYTPDTFKMRATGISSGDSAVAESETIIEMRRTGECRGDERKQ